MEKAQKVKYRIIACSSEDREYPFTELLTQSPNSRGWQSGKFCDYPQELTLQFMGPVNIRQIQLLSHQAKITSKVDIYTYLPDIQYAEGDLKYRKLGYLSLDSNERSGFQARELKSVYLNNRCSYMKLVLHNCHVNKFNLFNQVLNNNYYPAKITLEKFIFIFFSFY